MKKKIDDKIVIEIIGILLEMNIETYLNCKYCILAATKEPNVLNFFKELFKQVDEHRPKLIEMNGGVSCGC